MKTGGWGSAHGAIREDSDGRRLDHLKLEALRNRVVQRVEAGEGPERVIPALGFAQAQIYEQRANYGEGRIEALRANAIAERAAPRELSSNAPLRVYGDSNLVGTLMEPGTLPRSGAPPGQ